MSELLAWLDGIDLSRTRRLAPVAAGLLPILLKKSAPSRRTCLKQEKPSIDT
ncbi:hypothetical protein [Thauera humireducens]|uniref:hypothetical protein n=1 Tax=Thauera humireducens TaxID=1134435 RepID=UPI000A51549B|nr:hypothetical protein [Thauera humireducens]